MTNPRIVKSDPPETPEILAEAIVRIGAGFATLEKSGLNRRAIVLLLQDYTKVGKRDIELILAALPKLRGYYCR
jgi:hypothetical protein